MTEQWRGRFYEDLEVGDLYLSRLGRTVTEADNVWFTCLTMNTNQVHFNAAFASETRFKRPLVNSCLTIALVTGLSVCDTSENAAANLGWQEVALPHPVFAGDTLWAQSEVLSKRPSSSNPAVGIVTVRTRGLNQRDEVVIEFVRTFMIYRRDAAEVRPRVPKIGERWTVGNGARV